MAAAASAATAPRPLSLRQLGLRLLRLMQQRPPPLRLLSQRPLRLRLQRLRQRAPPHLMLRPADLQQVGLRRTVLGLEGGVGVLSCRPSWARPFWARPGWQGGSGGAAWA